MKSLREALKKLGFEEKKEKPALDIDKRMERGTLTKCQCCGEYYIQSSLPMNLALQNAVDDMDRCAKCSLRSIVMPKEYL